MVTKWVGFAAISGAQALLMIGTLSWAAMPASLGQVTAEERRNYIRQAQIWRPTDVRQMDILQGPEGSAAYSLEELVDCEYLAQKPKGTTSKFTCALASGRKVKIRYDQANGKVFAMPAATRLFWALGFGAIHSSPVRVFCHNCPADPYMAPGLEIGEQIFDPATLDEKLAGTAIEEAGKDDQGWGWNELDQVSESQGGATPAQRDALKLLAAFVQHGDNNPGQQRLICLPGGISKDFFGRAVCTKPFMYVSDLGSTFGGAEQLNERAAMNLAFWRSHPVWKDRASCVADLAYTPDATLVNPRIGEAGRRFLAHLLVQLTDHQIRDLFRVGRADRRNQDESGVFLQSAAPISGWVQAFKDKRDQIVHTRCPR